MADPEDGQFIVNLATAILRLGAVFSLAATIFGMSVQTAWAACGEASGGVASGDVLLDITCESAGSTGGGAGSAASGETEPVQVDELTTFTEGRWTAACNSQGVVGTDGSSDCGIARACPGAGISASYFSRTVTTRGNNVVDATDWAFVDRRCITFDPDNPPASLTGAPALPVVTWQMVLREIERVGLPSLRVQVQPEDKTLVNFRTNFYAEPEAFERHITLLGQSVDVRAEPTRFHWTFGDGGADATESSGSPYPDLEITHAYADAQVTVRPSVDVTYTAEFRVDGGSWQEIPQTVRIGGPPVSLRVVEATPVLSGEGQER